MYIIYNKHRNAYKTYDGWTTIDKGVLTGLNDVMRFTEREATLNENNMPSGSVFRYFPKREWSDYDDTDKLT